jgi:glycosyltransferase involved in cell wall biosynthesis
MKTKKRKVLYMFFNARKERIETNELSPSEFFYGYEYFRNKNFDVSVMEFDGKDIKYLTKFLLYFQKIILKITKFQYDFAGMFKTGKFQEIVTSDILIVSNNRIAHSILPALIYMKFKGIKCKTYVIAMGMFNFPKKTVFIKIHLFLNKFLIKYIDKLIFIGKSEFEHAQNIFKNYESKICFLPFGVDSKFWSSGDLDDYKNLPILFIGNDGNRDFDFLIELVKATPNENFIVISDYFEQSYIDTIRLDNLIFYKGSWNKKLLTDDFLKNIYANSKITVVPLKNSIQPSGQSVSLQSLSIGTPVIITKTDGFWDNQYFINEENIIFVQENNIEKWQKAINELNDNENLYKNLKIKGRELISKQFNTDKFNEGLHELIIDSKK